MGIPGCFQIICGIKYLEKEGMNYQQAYPEVFVSRSSLKHNLGADSLIAYSNVVHCRSGPFIKSRKKCYHFN